MDTEIAFYCPECSAQQLMDEKSQCCLVCGAQLIWKNGIYDFVGSTGKYEEREFYNEVYEALDLKTKQDIASIESLWERVDSPYDKAMLDIVGNTANQSILVLGNGDSLKEMVLAKNGTNRLVYSDLSPEASLKVLNSTELGEYRNKIRFCALDAENLPFLPGSFDTVYAYAMVHHLPNLQNFFDGVFRVLKPGGNAIFLDDAYSPIWHHSKQTVLKPLMKRSHVRHGISPEDLRFSLTGGFKELELEGYLRPLGVEPFFYRFQLLGYLLSRGCEKLLPRAVANYVKASWIQSLINRIDSLLGFLSIYKQNQIRLIWGFRKQLPSAVEGSPG